MSKTEKEICENATPGPWALTPYGITNGKTYIGSMDKEEDDFFVVTFCPAKIKSMLAEIEELKRNK
jgi:hypothetical protein